MSEPREPGDPPICPHCGEVMPGRFRCRCREVRVIERNNRASVHYWGRATHLLRRGEFERK